MAKDTWYVNAEGTKEEVQENVNSTDAPDSVKGFAANALAYYDDDTQITFLSEGSTSATGVIRTGMINIEAEIEEDEEDEDAEEKPKGTKVNPL